jgi:sirohydrochlorin ferrochelatase
LTSAYLLVSHGSRDPRSQTGVDRLAEFVRQNLALIGEESILSQTSLDSETAADIARSPGYLIGTARLEGAHFTLAQQIIDFAQLAIEQNYPQLVILPLFLLPGVHLQEDIPAELHRAQTYLGDRISIRIDPYLGSQPAIVGLLNEQFGKFSPQTRILLSHGTKRAGGNQTIETLAQALNAQVAYWSISPSLTEQVRAQIEQDQAQIAILPYFLFASTITDAIATTVAELSQTFPQAHLQLGFPLETTPNLAHLIADLISEGLKK